MSNDKDFYTSQELVDKPWFPVRSIVTVKRMVENGMLKGINVSINPKFKRYRILKDSVKKFIELEKEKEKEKKTIKSKKTKK